MPHLNDIEIKNCISMETFSDNALLAVSAIDLSTRKVIYANRAMRAIMADVSAKKCWEAIHGQESACSWCKVDFLLKNSSKENNYTIYEHFNEVANRWYQLQDKVIKLEDGREILISFALDITAQKEAQSKFIETHVKLVQQTKALKYTQKKLQQLANRDPLTNIYNRRYFADMAEKIVALSKREHQPLSLIMLDIDNFKKINDKYGHSVGDEVIKLLADRLIHLGRDSDITARFGGEEFAIILPNTDISNALKYAKKIKSDIEETTFTYENETIKFTISVGVDAFRHDKDKTIDESLNRADKALYKAKGDGKNRVQLYDNM